MSHTCLVREPFVIVSIMLKIDTDAKSSTIPCKTYKDQMCQLKYVNRRSSFYPLKINKNDGKIFRSFGKQNF